MAGGPLLKLYDALPGGMQNAVRALRNAIFRKRIIERWRKSGRPVPPPHAVKINAIREYQERFGLDTLVETGTYLGDMVNSQKRRFQKIISIEIDQELCRRAEKRFRRRPSISIRLGDSGRLLGPIVKELASPALFWLDGHYSGGVTGKGESDCPILKEIDAIFSGERIGHVLLIDDARCFTGSGDYPTIPALEKYVLGKAPDYTMKIEDDIIRFFKKESGSDAVKGASR